MKYKNKIEVAAKVKEIESLVEMHRKVNEADYVDMKYGPDTNFRAWFEDLKDDTIEELFNDEAIVFKSKILTHISNKIAELKKELEKL